MKNGMGQSLETQLLVSPVVVAGSKTVVPENEQVQLTWG